MTKSSAWGTCAPLRGRLWRQGHGLSGFPSGISPAKSAYRKLTHHRKILDEVMRSVYYTYWEIVRILECGSPAAVFPFWAHTWTLGSEPLLNRQLSEAAHSAQFWCNTNPLKSTLTKVYQNK